MAQLNFNAAQVEPNAAFDPIPAGWYTAQVTDSEMKPTKAGDGSYLSITLQILGGDFNNRKVFDRFNINNKNPVAVDIAYKQLSALCHAVGILQVQDSQQLHGKPVQIKVSLKPASQDPQTGAQYDAGNEVKGYKAVEGGMPIAGQPAGGAPAWATQQQPAAAAAPKPLPPAMPAFQPQQPAFQQQPQQPVYQQPAQVQQQPAQQPWQQQPAAQPMAQQAPVQPAQAPAQAPATQAPPWAAGAPVGAVNPAVAEPPQAQAVAAAGATPPWARPAQ